MLSPTLSHAHITLTLTLRDILVFLRHLIANDNLDNAVELRENDFWVLDAAAFHCTATSHPRRRRSLGRRIA
ncbi:hypothetical protein OG21DRAFT_1518592 [Imleria badia]|nr:hypothetical protein OG21DRAFT_1518592 [Imleria badia]